MTEPIKPTPDESDAEQPTSDETFTWTTDAASGHAGGAGGPDAAHGEAGSAGAGSSGSGSAAAGSTATAILESVREAVDDLAERATPTVREFSARAAEFAAVAADRAAPFARRAGEVTSDASAKLATRSRIWAADLRASLGTADTAATPGTGAPQTPDTATPPPPAPDAGSAPTDGPTPA
jgi:hypothetical protein